MTSTVHRETLRNELERRIKAQQERKRYGWEFHCDGLREAILALDLQAIHEEDVQDGQA